MLETLQLHLTTSATSYRPGDTVIALLQASSGSASVELQEVELQFSGVERIDTSWVSAAYRKDVPPINADKRHLQRYVAYSQLQAATQGTLGGARNRKFVVRFTLPPSLPPSFRGTAVRVSYTLSAAVHFRLVQPGSAAAADSPEGSVASFVPSEAATEQQLQDTVTPEGITTSMVQLPIHIWPLKAEVDGVPPSPGGAGTLGGEPLPAATSEDMPIKCWEIGPGTGVQEAIAHICRLVAQPPPASSAAGSSQRGEGGEGGEPSEPGDRAGGSGSSTDEAGGELGAAARLPLGRQATTDSERGLLLTPGTALERLDPSAVLRSYALRIGDHAIARVSLHPPVEGALHPGATLAGTIELLHPELPGEGGEGQPAPAPASPPAVPRCMQVLILLETEERLAAAWRPAGKGSAGGSVVRRVYEEQLEVTADLAATHFLFTVPPGSQANFTTSLLQLQWVLRFQFTASTPRGGAGGSNPLAGKIDQLTWALPLHVGAPQ